MFDNVHIEFQNSMFYCGFWSSGHKSKWTKQAKPTHFSQNPKNVSLSGQNRNFDYKFNDHKELANKTGFSILSARQRPAVLVLNLIKQNNPIEQATDPKITFINGKYRLIIKNMCRNIGFLLISYFQSFWNIFRVLLDKEMCIISLNTVDITDK